VEADQLGSVEELAGVGEPRSLEDGRTPVFVLPGEASCDLPSADGEVCEVRAGDDNTSLTKRTAYRKVDGTAN
jgi:hypothetical protein